MPDPSNTSSIIDSITTASRVLPSDQLSWALIIAVVVSLVIALIEILRKSQVGNIKACLSGPSFLYFIILSFGNVVTTILAWQVVVTTIPPAVASYYYLFSAFFGVFGFEIILKNTNITMFDKGVLTIKEWTEKALDIAGAAAVAKQVTYKQIDESRLNSMLMRKSDTDINTRVLNKWGAGKVDALNAEANASSADPKQYKVLQLIKDLSSSERSALLAELAASD